MAVSSEVRDGRVWFGGRISLPSYAGAYGGDFDQKDAGQEHPKIPQDSALPGPERGQLYQIDRDDITRLGTAYDNRPGYRSDGVPVTGRGERLQ
jgi:hypothetical protein